MSVCVFIAADCPLQEVRSAKHYPLRINIDTNEIYDGGEDDNYFLLPFDDVNIYCKKKYGVYLELPLYTDGRARQIIDYIKLVLWQTESVELWNVWLLGYWEYEDRPYIHKKTIRIDDVTVTDIKKINDVENWNNKDPDRPSFYCIEIVR